MAEATTSSAKISPHCSNGFIGRDDDGSLLVAFGDELEERVCRLLGEERYPSFINDQKIDAGEILQSFC